MILFRLLKMYTIFMHPKQCIFSLWMSTYFSSLNYILNTCEIRVPTLGVIIVFVDWFVVYLGFIIASLIAN